MTTQVFSQAAHLLGLDGVSQLAEPSTATMLLVCFAGVVIGRYLLTGKGSSGD